MRLINLGLEDEQAAAEEGSEDQGQDTTENNEPATEPVELNPNQTQDAIDAVNNQDSTEPAKVIKIANYKEELAALRAKNNVDESGGDDLGGSDDTSSEGDADTGDTDESSEDPSAEGEEGTDSEAEVSDDSEEEDEGQTEEEVAQEQYFKEGIQSAMESLEAAGVISQLYDMVERESQLGGVTKHTARSCMLSLEHYRARVGMSAPVAVPALEAFDGYSSSISATRELKLSMEGFLEDVWKAIKRFFKALWSWITSIFEKKKAGDSKDKPVTKETQAESIKELKELKDKLVKSQEEVKRLRAKDEEKNKQAVEIDINTNISKRIFKTGDKGTVAEIAVNCSNVTKLIFYIKEMVAEIVAKSKNVVAAILTGKMANPEDFFIDKGILGDSSFSNKKQNVGNYLTAITSNELVAGVASKFTLATKKQKLDEKNLITALKELSKQGFGLVTDSEGTFPVKLPRLSEQDIKDIDKVIFNIEKAYKDVLTMNNMLETLTLGAKSLSEQSSQLQSSDDEKVKQQANLLRSQSDYVGALTANATTSVEAVQRVLNSFVGGFKQYIGKFIS